MKRSKVREVSSNVAHRYVSHIVRPVSRVVSSSSIARGNFSVRPRVRVVLPNIQRRSVVHAPKRFDRMARMELLKTVAPDVYKKTHNCRKEFSKLLSWRAAQGSGRKRSRLELRNSKLNFFKRDC